MKTLILSFAISLLSISAFSQAKGGAAQQSGQKQAGYGQGTEVTGYTRPTYTPPANNANTNTIPQSSKSDGPTQPKAQPIDANKGNCTNTTTETYYIYVCPKCGYQSQFAGKCPKDSTLLESKACTRQVHK